VKLVSSTLLWQGFCPKPSSAPFQKLRKIWLLILQIILLILAVRRSRAFLCCQDKPAQLRVVILDPPLPATTDESPHVLKRRGLKL